MSVTSKKAYSKELYKALEKCQFIEETLRMCIFSAVEISRFQLAPHFPIKYKTEDISKLPLGALVNIFVKINNDTALHKLLRDITRERNEVAHRSLLFTLGELDDKDHMAEATRKMKEIIVRATKVHNNLLDVRYAFVRSLGEVKRSRPSDYSRARELKS